MKHAFLASALGLALAGCGNGEVDGESTASCLDGIHNGSEECDGNDFGGESCYTYGYDGGSLQCRSDCTIDLSGCDAPDTCNGGSRDAGEQCDGTDFGGDDCTDYGFDSGTLSCRANCTVDLSACFNFSAECARHAQCAGHPDGNRCVFFERRCGECVTGDDCSAPNSVCNLDFVCVPPSDQSCAAADEDRPYLSGTECVECVQDAHCTNARYPYCTPATHECDECRTDSDCTGDSRYPKCNAGRCRSCRVDGDCPGDEPLCVVDGGWCDDCDPSRCPTATPNCFEGACAECSYSSDCPGTEGCQGGTCVEEDIACSGGDECDANVIRDVCSDEGQCVTCETSWDCWWIFGDVCHETQDRCVACNEDDGCWGDDRCNADGDCVECLSSADCGGNTCDAEGECVGNCATSADCSAPTPHCHNAGCVSCVENSDCAGNPAGEYCAMNNECGECRLDGDCAGNPNGNECWYGTCASACDEHGSCRVDLGRYVCGVYPNNCRANFECGACGNGGTCLGLDCDCPADELESPPNNTSATASDLGNTPDNPNTDAIVRALSIHEDPDVDWFTFYAEDTGLGGNPVVTASLDIADPPSGDYSEYEITIWLNCADASDNDSVCTDGRPSAETTHGIGCTARYDGTITIESECAWTTDDSTTGLVRVRKLERHGRCDSYTLNLSVY